MTTKPDLTTADGITAWIEENARTLIKGQDGWEEVYATAAYIAECVCCCQRAESSGHEAKTGESLPMLIEALHRDQYDTEVIARIAENERLRQAFDDLFDVNADNLVWDSSSNGEWLYRQLLTALKGNQT